MSHTKPKIGEIREFREHRHVPLRKKGFAMDDLMTVDDLWNSPQLRLEPVTVKRRWDGDTWVAVSN